jgi:hypothetical protein
VKIRKKKIKNQKKKRKEKKPANKINRELSALDRSSQVSGLVDSVEKEKTSAALVSSFH